ncbi:MAG: hypothetical protein AN484_24425, partial [Aphanizomenon flos-aquae WA102]
GGGVDGEVGGGGGGGGGGGRVTAAGKSGELGGNAAQDLMRGGDDGPGLVLELHVLGERGLHKEGKREQGKGPPSVNTRMRPGGGLP